LPNEHLNAHPVSCEPLLLQAKPRSLSSRYLGAWQCAVQSLREDGPGVFVRGLSATLVRAFIVNAAIFASFEAATAAMNDLGPGGAAR
jgi:solute carrier family 25 (mitochondrial carnitine/acylcarnitine transporter), member 20/29